VVVERGRVRAVLRGPRAVRRAGGRIVDLGAAVLTPGLVDAHAHLELTALAGRVPATGGFGAWVGRLLALRARTPERELERGVRSGAQQLVRTGTTAVGDIDSTGLAARALKDGPLRVRLYREVLDGGDPERTGAAAARVSRALAGGAALREGLSPHAPFSVTPELLAMLARVARRRRLPVTVHWSETRAELDWLRDGRGPLAPLLVRSPHRSGLDLLADAGLLGPATSLVHGNLPERGEALRIARAGATLVHCPGSHRFFGRAPFPLAHYRARRVHLALGTDSAASNDGLDMRHEMALLRAAHPSLAPETVWRMATEGGARALGWSDALGALAPGRRADLALFEVGARGRRGILEELTTACPAVRGCWVGGRTTL